jgi:hypothetical protein
VRDQVRGRIVLADRATILPIDLTPPAKRQDDARVQQRFDPERADGPRPPGGGARTGSPSGPPPMTGGQINRRIDEFLVENGARIRLDDARREFGQVSAFSSPSYDVNRAVPSVMLRNEDYGRIARLLASGTPVELEFTIVNRLHPEGRTAYNVVADIPGSDLKDELVMIGGHLDSWHSATGATDNAIGCAVMMEAMRVIAELGLRPRRTIRLGLWSGEEQGLLGSRAYVDEHFGTFENPKPLHSKLSAYVNLDHGTGRPRGAIVFGPPTAAGMVRAALAPLSDLGVVGAISSRTRAFGGTDHTSFNAAGLPGINFDVDPIEYDTHTHHTNLDTYERILEADAKASVVAAAVLAYQLAMSDRPVPRFVGEDMPPARR